MMMMNIIGLFYHFLTINLVNKRFAQLLRESLLSALRSRRHFQLVTEGSGEPEVFRGGTAVAQPRDPPTPKSGPTRASPPRGALRKSTCSTPASLRWRPRGRLTL